MNRHLHFAAGAAAALLSLAAAADPGPPLGCGGQPGVGGCAPYTNISLSDGAGNLNLYEYDLPRIDISRSLPLSDARGTADLQGATLTARARQSVDGDVSNTRAVDLSATLVDLYTLHSGGMLPPGANVGIVVMAGAQGVGSIDVDGHIVQSILRLGLGSGVVSYHGGVLDQVSVIQAGGAVPTFQQFVVPLQVYANLTVQVGVPFEVSSALRTIVWEGAFLNFDSFFGLAHGAQLSFQMPPDFSVTSMGGFDSAAPVPEPQPAAMLTAGLVALALWSRRRGARA